jgi:hypothetical protein
MLYKAPFVQCNALDLLADGLRVDVSAAVCDGIVHTGYFVLITVREGLGLQLAIIPL